MTGVPDVEADANGHSGCDDDLCAGAAVVADGAVGALVVLVRDDRGRRGGAGGEQESVRLLLMMGSRRPRLLIRSGLVGFQINHLMRENRRAECWARASSVRLGQHESLAERTSDESEMTVRGEKTKKMGSELFGIYSSGY